MAVDPSDVQLVYPESQSLDIFGKVGGFRTNRQTESEVDSVFLPGCIVGSDSSEDYRDQYRKVYLKNFSDVPIYRVKVYGFNFNSNNIVKFALEKDDSQLPKIDGSEIIKDYLTAPRTFGTYDWIERHSDTATEIGNGGILLSGEGQGIWLRQRCLKNASELPTDTFELGIQYSESP